MKNAVKILLLLLVLALGLVNPASASFASRAKDSVQVRVASFGIEVTNLELLSADGELDANDPSDKVQYRVTVKNVSEVAIEYAVTATTSIQGYLCKVTPATGELAANGGTATVVLTISIKDVNQLPSASLTGLRIDVRAEQLD